MMFGWIIIPLVLIAIWYFNRRKLMTLQRKRRDRCVFLKSVLLQEKSQGRSVNKKSQYYEK